MKAIQTKYTFRKTSLPILLMTCVLLFACTQKPDNKAAQASTPEASTTNTAPTGKPVIDSGYVALFQKAKENLVSILANNPGNFIAGQHYTDLNTASKIATQDTKIEVIEFFSYGCGACFNAEPYMNAYALQVPEDVKFTRIPASFNPSFEILARAYYAATALGASEEAHLAMFDAIHVKRQNLGNEKALAAFYANFGVDKDSFLKAMNSFSVNSLIERDRKLATTYQVTGVPTVIVNGAYNTGGRKAGSMDVWMQILDTLVEKERKAKLAASN